MLNYFVIKEDTNINTARRRTRVLLIFLSIILIQPFFEECRGNTNQTRNGYLIGRSSDTIGFSKLSSQEHFIDSMFGSRQSPFGEYRTNRSRIFLKEVRNSRPERMDHQFDRGIGTFCLCSIRNDTIHVKTWLGFFGSFTFEGKIYENDFSFSFIPGLDQPVFKSKISDSLFKNAVIVDSRFQKLTLMERPHFTPGEQIYGVIEFSTDDYFEKRYDKIVDTIADSGKILFTCNLRSKAPF